MTKDHAPNPKGGNKGGSRVHQSTRDGVRQPDSNEPSANEGADPINDIRKQNPGETTTGDLTDELKPDDPHKVEKLAKAGRKNFDPNDGAD